MARVIGIGGVFFKAHDAEGLRDWYRRVLGLGIEPWGGVAFKPAEASVQPGACTVWSPFPSDTDYFAPSDKPYMVNLMVDDLDAMLARARTHGVEPVKPIMDEPNGRFAHIVDPEGTTIELWQPAHTDAEGYG